MGSNNTVSALRTTPNPEKDKSHLAAGRAWSTRLRPCKTCLTLENVDKRADYDLLSASQRHRQ